MTPAGGRGLGLGALPDSPVPAVAPSRGPRMMAVLAVVPTLAGLAIVGSLAVVGAAPPTDLFGLADRDTARVTQRSERVMAAGSTRCDEVDLEVEWGDRHGRLTVCDDPDIPASALEVGEEVVIESVPWSSEVATVDADGEYLGIGAGLAGGLWLTWLGVTWLLRYRRLVRGTAAGVRLAGTVTKQDPSSVAVVLSTPGFEGRRMVLLPVKHSITVNEADRVEIWSTRRSQLTHNPGGPWVLRARGAEAAYTHAWLRREKSSAEK